MKKNLVILGSCVTRDPLETNGLSESLLYYHCRSNLASLTNRTAYKDEIQIDGLPPSQRRCVIQDLEKTFRTDFEECVVVFDFIDDRFPIAVEDEGVFTLNPLAAHHNPELYKNMKVIRHFDPVNWPLVEHNITLFAE